MLHTHTACRNCFPCNVTNTNAHAHVRKQTHTHKHTHRHTDPPPTTPHPPTPHRWGWGGGGLDDFLRVITLTVFPKELDVFSLNKKIANDYALVLLAEVEITDILTKDEVLKAA